MTPPDYAAVKTVHVGCAALSIALKRGRTRGVRIAALVGAVATFACIVTVAVTKSPLGLLARL